MLNFCISLLPYKELPLSSENTSNSSGSAILWYSKQVSVHSYFLVIILLNEAQVIYVFERKADTVRKVKFPALVYPRVQNCLSVPAVRTEIVQNTSCALSESLMQIPVL